jgi:hypothetical protein
VCNDVCVCVCVCNSPEILQSQPYGEKADIWAMGCVLYQMATLKPPFFSNNMLTLAQKVRTMPPYHLTCQMYCCCILALYTIKWCSRDLHVCRVDCDGRICAYS